MLMEILKHVLYVGIMGFLAVIVCLYLLIRALSSGWR